MEDAGSSILRAGNAVATAIVASTATAVVTLLPLLAGAPVMLPYVAVVGFVVASLHVALIGMPLYLTLRQFWELRWWSATLGGAAVALGPVLVVALAQVATPESRFVLSEVLAPAAWLALVGGSGGLAFWWVMRRQPA